MSQKQINLTLPENLLRAAREYSKKFGFRNIQELAMEAMREKVFEEKDEFADKEVREGLLKEMIKECEEWEKYKFKRKMSVKELDKLCGM